MSQVFPRLPHTSLLCFLASAAHVRSADILASAGTRIGGLHVNHPSQGTRGRGTASSQMGAFSPSLLTPERNPGSAPASVRIARAQSACAKHEATRDNTKHAQTPNRDSLWWLQGCPRAEPQSGGKAVKTTLGRCYKVHKSTRCIVRIAAAS